MAHGHRDPDTTVPMPIADDVTTYVTVPTRVEEADEISDGRPKPIAFEVTKQANTIRMILPAQVFRASTSGEFVVRNLKDRLDNECTTVEVDGVVELNALQRLTVLQAMLEVAHIELEIDPNPEDGTMDGPPGAYDMESATIKSDLPIGEAIPLRRESHDEVDGVKMILFRPGMLRFWLLKKEEDNFSSIRPFISVPMRESAMWFLHHVTKTLKEYEPTNPRQATIMEVSAS